jgi:hypothetical protein
MAEACAPLTVANPLPEIRRLPIVLGAASAIVTADPIIVYPFKLFDTELVLSKH